jgi:peptidoglycan/LPS O-acetylase OafA/YrhL
MDKNTSHNLNIIRLFSALIIVAVHFYSIFISKFSYTYLPYFSTFVVGVFFIISGYVNQHSIQNHPNTFSFIKKRMIRILPSYYIALLFSFLLLYYFKIPFANESYYHFLLLQNLILEFPILQTNGSLWTLGYEFYLYFIFAFINRFKILYYPITLLVFVVGFMYNIYILLFYSLFFMGVFLYSNNFNIFKNKSFFSDYKKGFRRLGYYSYEIYLFHYPIFILTYLLMP